MTEETYGELDGYHNLVDYSGWGSYDPLIDEVDDFDHIHYAEDQGESSSLPVVDPPVNTHVGINANGDDGTPVIEKEVAVGVEKEVVIGGGNAETTGSSHSPSIGKGEARNDIDASILNDLKRMEGFFPTAYIGDWNTSAKERVAMRDERTKKRGNVSLVQRIIDGGGECSKPLDVISRVVTTAHAEFGDYGLPIVQQYIRSTTDMLT